MTKNEVRDGLGTRLEGTSREVMGTSREVMGTSREVMGTSRFNPVVPIATCMYCACKMLS